MSRAAPIDLTRLPPPDVIETLDFETILDALKDKMIAAAPEFEDVLQLESEPAVKILQSVAYEIMNLRGRGNDLGRARMIALATGADLDNIAANYGVERLVITAAQPNATPPVPAVYETDDALRYRAQLSIESWTNAGTQASYAYHALSASGLVRDVAIIGSAAAGLVHVIVLSHDNDGVPAEALLDAVTAAISLPTVRALNDTIQVDAATMTDFTVEAEVELAAEPGMDEVLASVDAAVSAYLDRSFRVGQVVRRSALLAALHRDGVEAVTLTSPAADVDPGPTGAARCTGQVISHVVAS